MDGTDIRDVIRDDLTGLPNRTTFLSLLHNAVANATPRGGTLFFVGLDNFAEINELLGHAEGNALLRAAGHRLQEIATSAGTVARLTGVEFAILRPDIATIECASVFAEHLIHNLQRRAITTDQGLEIDLPASVGIARYPQDGSEPGGLMRNADFALSRARLNRAGRYHFFEDEMRESALRRRMIQLELRHALARNEMEVYYQPKVDLRSAQITGMEALIRWRHPEHGMIPPDQFIPIAEGTGLIAPISEWLMRDACAQTRHWNDIGLADLRLAVNLSTVQFRRQSVIGTITSILDDTGLPPDRLEVEITESVLLGDDEVVHETFNWMRHIGIPIAIDDFGTGYSSLSYLMRVAADTVKIDASFVKDMHVNQDGATITRAIISLAHSLGMKVVAEGIELGDHVSFLAEEDCDLGQGYFFGRPIPAPAFEALLREQPQYLERLGSPASAAASADGTRRAARPVFR